jgi:hypothetical protein
MTTTLMGLKGRSCGKSGKNEQETTTHEFQTK